MLDLWMFFDRPLQDGQLAVEVLLATDDRIGVGERNFLTLMQGSAMHLWEVEDALPGVSLSLRDVLENTRITVQERSASRTLARHEWIAARVVPRGASGAPEIERGVLHIPQLFHDGVRAQLTGQRAEFLRDNPGANLQAFYKDLPPFFHDLWAGSILEPIVPELHNTALPRCFRRRNAGRISTCISSRARSRFLPCAATRRSSGCQTAAPWFMVRGPWRRAQKSWADQRMRWVAPYWKGPDVAAIIERTYRLTP